MGEIKSMPDTHLVPIMRCTRCDGTEYQLRTNKMGIECNQITGTECAGCGLLIVFTKPINLNDVGAMMFDESDGGGQ